MRPFHPKTYLVEVLGPYVGASGAGVPGVFERYLLEPGDDGSAIATRMADVKALWDTAVGHPRYGQLIRTLSAAHVEAGLTLGDPHERARQAARVADPPVAEMPEAVAQPRRQRVRNALSELAQDAGEPRLALSLYHALGLEITEKVALVRARHEAAVDANAKRPLGRTAALYEDVLAEARLLLLDADPRAYIEGLVLDVKDEMEFEAAQAAAGSDVIDEIDAEQLLRLAVELGLTPALARRVVDELAQDHDASVRVANAVDYVACPACNALHPALDAPNLCRRCGTALFVACPAEGCATCNEATAWRCSNCQLELHRHTDAIRRLAMPPSAVADGIANVKADDDSVVLDGTPLDGPASPHPARAAVRPTATIELRYEVRRTGLRKRRLRIEVHAPVGADAPGLELVARNDGLFSPHASDGEVLARLGGDRPLTSTVDLGGWPRPLTVQLFLEATVAAHDYRLVHPPADDLLIG